MFNIFKKKNKSKKKIESINNEETINNKQDDQDNNRKVETIFIRKTNENHIFVHLPVFLLKVILKKLNNNLDRIAFSLVCSRWFNLKDQYLLLDLSSYVTVLDKHNDYSIINYSKECSLSSYQKVIENSLEKTSEIRFNIYESITDEEVNQLNVPLYINRVYLTTSIDELLTESLLCFFERHPHITSLYIKTLSKTPYKKFLIPDQIKSLSIVNSFESLGVNHPYPMGMNMFNEGLEHLMINTKNVDTLLKPIHMFPSTLKSLEYTGQNFLINSPLNSTLSTTLPPNLEDLKLDIAKTIGFKGFPSTLRSIGITSLWFKKMKEFHFPFLHSIQFQKENTCHLEAGDIPEGVTHLIFPDHFIGDNYFIPHGVVPVSCTYLDLNGPLFELRTLWPTGQFTNFFPKSTSKYEYLRIGRGMMDNEIRYGYLPEIVKELVFDNRHDIKIYEDSLPDGLESLTIGPVNTKGITNFIPGSVKYLSIYDVNNGLQIKDIPRFVKSLKLINRPKFYTIDIPDHITTLHLDTLSLGYGFREFKNWLDHLIKIKTLHYIVIDELYHFKRIDDLNFLANYFIPPDKFLSRKDVNFLFTKSISKLGRIKIVKHT